jgi:quercetin dioxygenase-like cupin family protein
MRDGRFAAAVASMAWLLTVGIGTASQVPPSVSAQVPGACETPVEQRVVEMGCNVTASERLAGLPREPLFWHLDEYPSRIAAEAAKRLNGTVVESLGRIWLYTIAPSTWTPSDGKKVAVVGPLPTRAGVQYIARYMEVVFPPGIESRDLVHRHSGPEAWYLLSGAQCLETPDGANVVRAGESGVVPEGPPMSITAIGNDVRRSVLLVLHDASKPWATMATDWQPRGPTGFLLPA